MTDRVLIMSCALGDVYLDTREPNDNPLIHFLLVGGDRELEFEGPRYHHDILLPGEKFSARELLNEYLFVNDHYRESEKSKTYQNIGTWHFTPEAISMAKAALREWEGK